MPDPLVKPYPEFPLTPHKQGYWVKVVRGKQHRIAKRWASPEEAIAEWYRVKDALTRGEPVPSDGNQGVSLQEACAVFLGSRNSRVESGELTRRSYQDYERECKHVCEVLGWNTSVLTIGQAQFSKLRAEYKGTPTVISNRIGRVRVLFKFIYDAGIVQLPFRYGPDFVKPSAKTKRLHRASKPMKLFTQSQIELLVANAKPQMTAMIYLGLFAGYGNHDVGTLLVEHVDLVSGWVTYHRPKTGITRRAWLPPRAVEALREIMPASGHVFVTKYGNSWAGDGKNPVSAEFIKLARALEIPLSFYALRHTCETIGGNCKDQVAVDYVMGHAATGMSGVYRETINDDRLKAVSESISSWLAQSLPVHSQTVPA